MSRIIGLDFGIKKCGVAATDNLQLIVTPLDTIETKNIYLFFEKYMKEEDVQKLVVGLPKHKDGNFTYLKKDIDIFVSNIQKKYPDLEIDFEDEGFTSMEAKEIILRSGIRKSKRRDKTLVDRISAVLILQRYLGHY
ncbi:MAG: Holliday junction resolvase RuvX [Saprospiraceae bacterium]|nr:Holliday junction resolvase RuvX [Saprospiraceae bacterium]